MKKDMALSEPGMGKQQKLIVLLGF